MRLPVCYRGSHWPSTGNFNQAVHTTHLVETETEASEFQPLLELDCPSSESLLEGIDSLEENQTKTGRRPEVT